MSKILVVYGKHGHDYYDISTEELEAGAYLQILKDNHKMGYYYESEDLVNDIIENKDWKKARQLVQSRYDMEYERTEIETPTQAKI